MSLPSNFDSAQEALRAVINILEPLRNDQRRFVLHSTAAWFNDSDTTALPSPHNTNTEPEPANLQDFVFFKKTKNDAEAVAVLAYYLEIYRNQKLFKTTDLDKLNHEAGTGQKFGNITKIVNNATQRNQFFAIAGNGFKQLTPLGRMIVKALPDEEEVKKIIKEHKPRPQKRKATKKDVEQ